VDIQFANMYLSIVYYNSGFIFHDHIIHIELGILINVLINFDREIVINVVIHFENGNLIDVR